SKAGDRTSHATFAVALTLQGWGRSSVTRRPSHVTKLSLRQPGGSLIFSRYAPLWEVSRDHAPVIRLASSCSLSHVRVLSATRGDPREARSHRGSRGGQRGDAENRLHLPAHQARLRAVLPSLLAFCF